MGRLIAVSLLGLLIAARASAQPTDRELRVLRGDREFASHGACPAELATLDRALESWRGARALRAEGEIPARTRELQRAHRALRRCTGGVVNMLMSVPTTPFCAMTVEGVEAALDSDVFTEAVEDSDVLGYHCGTTLLFVVDAEVSIDATGRVTGVRVVENSARPLRPQRVDTDELARQLDVLVWPSLGRPTVVQVTVGVREILPSRIGSIRVTVRDEDTGQEVPERLAASVRIRLEDMRACLAARTAPVSLRARVELDSYGRTRTLTIDEQPPDDADCIEEHLRRLSARDPAVTRLEIDATFTPMPR